MRVGGAECVAKLCEVGFGHMMGNGTKCTGSKEGSSMGVHMTSLAIFSHGWCPPHFCPGSPSHMFVPLPGCLHQAAHTPTHLQQHLYRRVVPALLRQAALRQQGGDLPPPPRQSLAALLDVGARHKGAGGGPAAISILHVCVGGLDAPQARAAGRAGLGRRRYAVAQPGRCSERSIEL